MRTGGSGGAGGSLALYVTDLDFTLLRSDATLSERTMGVLNQALGAGCWLTFATARSYISAARVTRGLRLTLPVITYGGAVLVNPHTAVIQEVRPLPAGAVQAIQAATAAHEQIEPLLFAMVDGRDRVCWRERHASEPVRSFVGARAADPRLLPLGGWSELDPGQVFYATLIGTRHGLLALRDQLGTALSECFVTMGPDGYSRAQTWLEICSRDATKAAAASRLRRRLGADSLVAFGDNLNDVPLFEIADQAFAVANAVPELRAVATGSIGGNDEDGVAAWLECHVLRNR